MGLTKEENETKVISVFEKSLKGINTRNLFVFDFDELLVHGHLSCNIINSIQSKEVREKILQKYPDYTFEALNLLNIATLEGIAYDKALEIKKRVVENTPWREHAVKLLTNITNHSDYHAVVLSCGRYTPIRMKLDSEGLQKVPVIATEVDRSGETIESKHVITENSKGNFITYARQKRKFERIIAVGHGTGDIPMIQQADLGIALREDPVNTRVESEADTIIKNLDEIYYILD